MKSQARIEPTSLGLYVAPMLTSLGPHSRVAWQAYVTTHQLSDALTAALADAIQSRTDEPLALMADYLRKLQAARTVERKGR